jgi:hypothetical protein
VIVASRHVMETLSMNVDELTETDLSAGKVWRFGPRSQNQGFDIIPVKKRPVKDLFGKIASCNVVLNDGQRNLGLVGNVDPNNLESNEHFTTLSIMHHGVWFHLARYFDFDYEKRAPPALARFLGKEVDQVFPITVDLTWLFGSPGAEFVLTLEQEPKRRLSLAEIAALAVP